MQTCEHNTPYEVRQVRWVDEREVAAITGISLSTLRKYRMGNVKIPFCKIGRSVRYRLSDVVAFMDAHRIEPRG